MWNILHPLQQQVTDAKYLGVIIDSKLSFNKHVDMNCKKANSTLVFLRRNLYHCQRNVKVDAYQTYVRPILEYAVTACTPDGILIKMNPFNDEQQDLFCQIFQLTVASLSCYLDWNGVHYIIEDMYWN